MKLARIGLEDLTYVDQEVPDGQAAETIQLVHMLDVGGGCHGDLHSNGRQQMAFVLISGFLFAFHRASNSQKYTAVRSAISVDGTPFEFRF